MRRWGLEQRAHRRLSAELWLRCHVVKMYGYSGRRRLAQEVTCFQQRLEFAMTQAAHDAHEAVGGQSEEAGVVLHVASRGAAPRGAGVVARTLHEPCRFAHERVARALPRSEKIRKVREVERVHLVVVAEQAQKKTRFNLKALVILFTIKV